MTAAKILCELGGKSLCRRGVELARHVDEQDVLRADGIDVECGGNSGVDAARDANDDALHVDAREEFPYGIAECAVDGRDGRLCGSVGRGGECRRVDDGHAVLVGGRDEGTRTVRAECLCAARKGVDGLALVLKAERVDVEEHGTLFLCCLGEGACLKAERERAGVGGEDHMLSRQLIEKRGETRARTMERTARDLAQDAVARVQEGAREPAAALSASGDIAKNDGDAVRRSGDLLGVGRAVTHEGRLLPYTAEKEA